MKQYYWSKTKWCWQCGCSFLSSVLFESDIGKILFHKGVEAACHCRFWLGSSPEISPIVGADFGLGSCGQDTHTQHEELDISFLLRFICMNDAPVWVEIHFTNDVSRM